MLITCWRRDDVDVAPSVGWRAKLLVGYSTGSLSCWLLLRVNPLQIWCGMSFVFSYCATHFGDWEETNQNELSVRLGRVLCELLLTDTLDCCCVLLCHLCWQLGVSHIALWALPIYSAPQVQQRGRTLTRAQTIFPHFYPVNQQVALAFVYYLTR